jgi:hypothetical protein
MSALALACALPLALLVPPAVAKDSASKHKGKPDLVVESGRVGGKPFVFWGDRDVGPIVDTIENRGSGRAGPSLTRVYLEHGKSRYLLADRAVPGLRPGEHDRGEDSLSPKFHRPPPGGYEVVICADAKDQVDEPEEQNNCKPVLKHFYVAVRSWRGSLSGTATPVPSWNERWQSSSSSFDYETYTGDGKFLYLFSGTVTWSDHAVDNEGCTWTGAGEESFQHDQELGGLTIDYLNENFDSGGLLLPTGDHYDVTATCPDGHNPPTQSGPLEHTFWLPSTGAPVGMPFGSKALPGSPAPVFGTTYVWSFQAVSAG